MEIFEVLKTSYTVLHHWLNTMQEDEMNNPVYFMKFSWLPYMPWSLVTSIYFTNIYLTMIMRGSCYHDVSYYDFVGFPYLYSWNNEFLHNTTHINSISCVNLLLMNAKISVQYFYPECYFSVCDTFMLETNIFQKQIFIFFRVT